ncbi:MAG: dephospho-CoA kinase [Paludibacteraceae bacterium]
MALIGITGGIGSGKSTLAAELQKLGYAVYNTDAEAKRIIVSNPMVRSQIEMLFGSDVYNGDTYLTKRVAQQVFHHPELLAQLNSIVHPAVAFDVQQWQRRQEEQMPICFVEAAILFESGMDRLCDKVVAVTAPESICMERALKRDYKGSHDKTHIAAVQARMRNQMSDEERSRRADITVLNDGNTPIAILAQEVLQQILS